MKAPKDIIFEKLSQNGDNEDSIEAYTFKSLEEFTVWTKEWIYFPGTYDGEYGSHAFQETLVE